MKAPRRAICLIVVGALGLWGGAAASTAAAPQPTPAAWLTVDLKDVVTGKTFKVADFKGRVTFVEAMAVWCPLCTAQQREFQKLSAEVPDEIVFVSIDIDPNENAEILRRHTETNGFKWPFAVAPRALARKLAEEFGDRILHPPSTPVLIVDKNLQARLLRFGVKSAAELKQEIVRSR